MAGGEEGAAPEGGHVGRGRRRRGLVLADDLDDHLLAALAVARDAADEVEGARAVQAHLGVAVVGAKA